MGVINKFRNYDPKNDIIEICEWVDAGIFSGDLLYCIDLENFKDYLSRWNYAVEKYEETLKQEQEEKEE